MSKLAMIRQYSYSPAAGGGLLGGVIGAVGKFIGKGLGIIKPKVIQVATQLPKSKAIQVIAPAVAGGIAYAGAEKLMGGHGASGGWTRRRSRGITARELRGYRKVARLLHQEGMVSRRARGRK